MRRLGLILFGLIILYFIFLIRQDIIDNLALKREGERIQKGITQEEELGTRLGQRLKLLRQAGFIEQLAREKLGLIKRGETAYKVPRWRNW